MRGAAWFAAALVVGSIAIFGFTMHPTTSDWIRLAVVVVVAAAIAFGLRWLLQRVGDRVSSLPMLLGIPAIGSLVVVAIVVTLAAAGMVLDTPQLPVVFVAIGLGAGLAILATALVAQQAVDDLGRVLAVAGDVADGDLGARTGVERPDEIGQLAEAVDRMVAALEAAAVQRADDEAARRAFLVAVGHDLRTPLTAISAAAEAIEDGIATDPAAYSRAIRTQVAAMERLVADLTRLTALEAGDVHPEPVDLVELVDETIEVMGPLATTAAVTLTASEVDGSWDLDPHAVGRLLRNLIQNAIDHAHSSVRLDVEVGDDLVLTVTDDGPGFPAELGDRVFDRFVTGDPSRRDEGFGLGLAIARSVAVAHGGSIRLGHGPGGAVEVVLPAHPPTRPTA